LKVTFTEDARISNIYFMNLHYKHNYTYSFFTSAMSVLLTVTEE